ncbi:MAG: methyltransferase family protein [Planctomycetota bacterium]|jgi:protein-S-isoprenylcysteine O-methyltransferase Ste14
MWIIRFILLGALGIYCCVDLYSYRYHSRYGRLLENIIFNITTVIVGHVLCYLIVSLPPAEGWNARPIWLGYRSVSIGFPVIGFLLICAGAFMAIATFKQRKLVIGYQDTEEGLLTSGFYQYFRHPIYTGTMWVILGLPLVMRNPDGLLMFPAIFVIHFTAAIIEERNDMLVRFREQYQAYRQTTRMFGPIWLWSVVVGIILLLVGFGWIIEMR